MNYSVEKQADFFKFISDPTRLKIIKFLFDNQTKEICVSDISRKINISHSATSHQLAKLERFGLVKCFRKGQMMCYKATDNKINRLIKKVIKNTL